MLRFLPAVVGVAVLALAGHAPAATVTLTNLTAGASTCDYTGVSGDASGNVTYTCAASSQPSAGTLALAFAPSAATSIVTGTGSTNIQLRRSGATANGGAASGTVAVSGGCTLTPAGGSVSFADGVNRTDSYAVGAGTAAAGATCSVTLTGVTGATAGTASLSVSITATPPPPPSGCAPYSGRTFVWTGSQVKIDPFNPGTLVALEIDTSKTPLRTSTSYYGFGAVLPSGNDPAKFPEAVEASLSLCPGDFTGPTTYGAKCGVHAVPSSTSVFSLRAVPGRKLSTFESYTTCALPETTKFYLNMRLTKKDGSGASSCSGTNCPIFVNVSN